MSTSGRTQLKGQAGFICSISIEPVYVCVCDTLARWLAHLTACVFNVLEAYTGSSDNRGAYCYSELTSLLQWDHIYCAWPWWDSQMELTWVDIHIGGFRAWRWSHISLLTGSDIE